MKHTQQQGFTLIEILVAFLIFNLVLLGVAKGYLLVEHQMSDLRQQKKVLSAVTELVQRQHRNLHVDYFQPFFWQLAVDGDIQRDSGGVQSCFSEQGCSPEELRSFDIQWFKQQVESLVGATDYQVSRCSQVEYQCLTIQANKTAFIVSSLGLPSELAAAQVVGS